MLFLLTVRILDDEPQIEDEDEMHYIVENFVLQEEESEFFWRKDDSIWRKKEENKQRRTPQHNIFRGPRPGPTRRARNLSQAPGKLEVWDNYFDPEILNEILSQTNKKLRVLSSKSFLKYKQKPIKRH